VSAPRPRRGDLVRAALLPLILLIELTGRPAAAEDPDRTRIDAEEAMEARWRERARELRERVEIARERLASAEADYESMRAVNHPRGEAKRAVIDRVEDAKHALADAEQQSAALEASAQAAGVPALWLETD